MTLKQMIEEAKQMAQTPSGSQENLYRDYQRSPSVHSIAESVVSVIERQKPPPPQQQLQLQQSPNNYQHHLKPSMISVTPEILVTPEPTPPRSTPPVRPPRTPSPRRNSNFNDMAVQQQQYAPTPSPKVTEKGFQWPTSSAPPPQMADNRNQVGPAAPASSGDLSPAGRSPGGRRSRADLNSMPATSPLLPGSTPMARRDSNSAAAKPAATNQPMVGADRYEEIIKARDRSSSRGPGSIQGSMTNLFQPGITMAMREETKQMSMSRSSLISSSMMVDNLGSMGKLNQSLSNIERPSSSMANLQQQSMISSQTNLNTNNHLNGSQPILNGSQPILNGSQPTLNMNNGM